MAITVNHQFVSAKGDGSDATLVRPSNWNASHNINLATSKIIGRLTAGPGLAEELPVTSFMIGLLNTADFAALAVALGLPTTGDAKLTYKVVADAGWVLANDGTVGDALSGSSTRANADTVNLFTFFYNTFSDVIAPVLTSTGGLTTRAAQGTAASAFGAHCRMLLPRQLGRALIVAGAGPGLTNRVLGDFGGEEAHVLTLAELAAHSHTQQGTFGGSGSGSGSISGSGSGSCSGTTDFLDRSLNHRHHASGDTGGMSGNNPHNHPWHATDNLSRGSSLLGSNSSGPGGYGGGGAFGYAVTFSIDNTDIAHGHHFDFWTENVYPEVDTDLNHKHNFSGGASVSVSGSCSVTSVSVNTTISGQTVSSGSGAAHNIMQPWVAWNIMIRL